MKITLNNSKLPHQVVIFTWDKNLEDCSYTTNVRRDKVINLINKMIDAKAHEGASFENWNSVIEM